MRKNVKAFKLLLRLGSSFLSTIVEINSQRARIGQSRYIALLNGKISLGFRIPSVLYVRFYVIEVEFQEKKTKATAALLANKIFHFGFGRVFGGRKRDVLIEFMEFFSSLEKNFRYFLSYRIFGDLFLS